MACYHQDINRPVSGVLGRPKVNTDQLQWPRSCYALQGGPSLRLDCLADNASLTMTDIVFHVPVKVWPEKPLYHQAEAPVLSLMYGSVVNSMQNFSLERVRNNILETICLGFLVP